MRKLKIDQELRKKQEEEMAQIYPAKYSWVNGGKFERSSHGGSGSSANNDEAKVFDTYGGNLDSPLIRAQVDRSNLLQLEKEMKSVSIATPRLRQKWQKEENRAVSLSPVLPKKQLNDSSAFTFEKQRTSSTGQDDKAVLEEQLRKLQLEAQLAR